MKMFRIFILVTLVMILLLPALFSEAADNVNSGTELNRVLSSGNYAAADIEALIKAGADVNVISASGKTPLLYAIGSWRKPDPEVIRILVEAGADVNAKCAVFFENFLQETTPLISAMLHHRDIPEVIKILVQAGADVNARSVSDMPALRLARDFETVKLMVRAGADVNEKSGYSEDTALHEFVRRGDVEAVKYLLEAGADVNARDSRGETPITGAIFGMQDSEVIGALLEAGADPNEALFYIVTEGPFRFKTNLHADDENMYASYVSETISVLVKAGADINARDSDGFSPLNRAVSVWPVPGAVKALLEAGADVNARNPSGLKPLTAALDNVNFDAKTIKLLLDAGFDVNERDAEGFAQLTSAINKRLGYGTVKALLDAGANVNDKSASGWTPLSLALEKHLNEQTIILLLEAGADIDVKTPEGETAFRVAYEKYRYDSNGVKARVFGALLNSAANAEDIEDWELLKAAMTFLFGSWSENYHFSRAASHESGTEGWRAIKLALKEGASRDILKILLNAEADADYSAGRTALWEVVGRHRNIKAMTFLLRADADAAIQDENGQTPFTNFLEYVHYYPDLLKLMINAGADVNARGRASGKTALEQAIDNSDYGMVKFLLEAGADVETKDSSGNTPLMNVLRSNKRTPDITRLLVEAGANVEEEDDRGYAPLMIAAENDSLEELKILLEAGADAGAKDSKTLKDAVLQDAGREVIEELIKVGADAENVWSAIRDESKFWDLKERTLRKGAKTLIEFSAGAENNGWRALKIALENGFDLMELEVLINLLPKPGDGLESKDSDGLTALRRAITGSNPRPDKIFEVLTKAGVDIDEKDEQGRTGLIFAIESTSQRGVVFSLLKHGADVLARDNEGRTAAKLAIDGHYFYDATVMLIRAEAEKTPNRTASELLEEYGGVSILSDALRNGEAAAKDNAAIAAILAEKFGGRGDIMADLRRAEMNPNDSEGWKAIGIALEKDASPDLIENLLEAEANADYSRGVTALSYAASKNLGAESVMFLLAAGADANMYETFSGGTILHEIAEDWTYPIGPELLGLLINAGVDVDAKGGVFGSTALQILMRHEPASFRLESAKTLIEAGADVNAADKYGDPILIKALAYDNAGLLETMIKAGADVEAKDTHGDTALQILLKNSPTGLNLEAVKVLIEAGADVNATSEYDDPIIFDALKYRNPELLETLIKAGADVKTRKTATDQTVLQVMLESLPLKIDAVDFRIAELLIEAGAEVDVEVSIWETALLWAVDRADSPALIKLLIEGGANTNARDYSGRTPLLLLAEKEPGESHPAIMELLIKGGADVNAADDAEMTPLLTLAGKERVESRLAMMELLIKNGADVNVMYGERTPLQLLLANGEPGESRLAAVAMLIKGGADANIEELYDRAETQEDIDAILGAMDEANAREWIARLLENKFPEEHITPELFIDYIDGFPRIKKLIEDGALAGRKLGENIVNSCADWIERGTELEYSGQLASMHDLEKYIEAMTLVAGDGHERTAESLGRAGSYFFNLGALAEAKGYIERALAAGEKLFGEDDERVVTALASLADVCVKLGDFEKAGEYGKRVLAMRTAADENGADIARLGMIYAYLGDDEKALDYLTRALKSSSEKFGGDHTLTADVMLLLGEFYFQTKEYQKAASYLERALGVKLRASRTPDGSAISYEGIFFMLGINYEQMGMKEAAVLFCKMAVDEMQKNRSAIRRMEEDLQKSYLYSQENTYRSLVDLLLEQGRTAEAQQVLTMLRETKFLDFLGQGGQADPRNIKMFYSQTEERFRDWFSVIETSLSYTSGSKRRLAMSREEGTWNAGEWEIFGEEQLAEIEAAERAAAVDLAAFFAEVPDGLSANSESSRKDIIRMNDLYIQNLRKTVGVEKGTAFLQTVVAESQTWIILTVSDAQIITRSAVGMKEISHKARVFRELLEKPDRGDPREAARELYNMLIAPVKDELEKSGARTLIFLPDGALRYVPAAALYDGDKWLSEKYDIVVYTDAARLNTASYGQTAEREAAALGVTKSHRGFSALPAVYDELESIVRRKNEEDADGVLQGAISLDTDFTESSLADAVAGGAGFLHVATHFSLEDTIDASFLLLGDGGVLTLKKIHDDALRFETVDLFTLSACNTAVGLNENAGTEMEGLGRLAQRQGAKSVMATLWSVADASTAVFMSRFYTLFQEEHMTKAEALRQTQVEFINGELDRNSLSEEARGRTPAIGAESTDFPGYSHPFYWAPFILMGDWL